MSTTADLAVVRETLEDLAFCMIDQTHESPQGMLSLLSALDRAAFPWQQPEQAPEDHYRLGVLMGMVGHMAACQMGPDGEMAPVPIDLDAAEDPVVRAVGAVRDAVLGFPVPSA